MKTGILVALGVALIAIYLLFSSSLLSSSETSDETSDKASQESAESGKSPAAGKPLPRRAKGKEGTSPAAPGGHSAPLPSETPPLSYELHDGTKVVDHPENPSEPNLEGYVVLPKTVSKVEAGTLVAVRGALRPAMNQCIETHGQGAEEGARIQASLIVSIKEELLRIDKARVQISGLEEQDALRKCVTDQVVGHEQTIAGAQDVDSHRMIFPYDL